MIFLDTNAVIYLYTDADFLPEAAVKIINENDCFISPMVKLELQYLHEIGRAKPTAQTIINSLEREIGLELHSLSFNTIIDSAMKGSWTRDPFDRLITAHAKALDKYLVTSDHIIQKHYKKSIWK